MNSQLPMTRPLIFCAVLGLSIAAGCSDDPECDAFTAADINPILTPRTIFTGADGEHEYQAVISTNFGDVEYFSNDMNIATVITIGCLEKGQFGPTGLVTAVGPGETTITVGSGGLGQDVKVEVTSYTPAQNTLGDERYNNPANPNSADRIACGTCHLGGGGAPHDPLALASRSDAELIAATKLSKYPDRCELENNTTCNCTPDPAAENQCGACPEGVDACTLATGYELDLAKTGGGPGEHLFNLTPDEEAGIMAYMRSLPPEGI